MSNSVDPWDALERAVEQGRRYGRRADHFEERALAAETRLEDVRGLMNYHDHIGNVPIEDLLRALNA